MKSKSKREHKNAAHCLATKWADVAANGLTMSLHFQLNYPNSLMMELMKFKLNK